METSAHTVVPRASSLARGPQRGRRGNHSITLDGVAFIAITLALGFAAVNTGNNLIYLFFSLLMAFLLISGVAASQALRRLTVERIAPRYAYAEERFPMTLIIRNNKRLLSSYSLRAEDRSDTGETIGAGYALRVPPRGRLESSYAARLPRRGICRLEVTRLISRYPFGFYERSVEFDCVSDVLVFPRVLPIGEWAAWSPVALGEREAPRKGMGNELFDLREYQPGDSARRIHWKVSARTNRLVAREFESEERARVTLLLDNGVPDPDDPEVAAQFERGVIACASLASAYLERGFQVALFTRSGLVPMSQGQSHLLRTLRSLALIELIRYRGTPLWLPPPSAEEAHIAIHYLPGPSRGAPPNVDVVSIDQTPPFAHLAVPAPAATD